MQIPASQRRHRLARRHHLAGDGGDPVTVARALLGFHGSDPASVYLSAAARCPTTADGLAQVMYDERALVRILVMRRTVFTLPLDLARVASAACATALEPQLRKTLIKQLESSGRAKAGPWLGAVEAETLRALEALGEATGEALADAVPGLQQTIGGYTDKAYDKPVRVTTRVLTLLAVRGLIVRARPTGNLTSARYSWAPMSTWIPGGLQPMDPEGARAELVRLWLASYGPGTVEDVQWWTGFTKGAAKKALAAIGAVEVALQEGPGFALADDLDPVEAAAPCAALVPALDPTAMGWKGRAFYNGTIDKHRYDYSGNICPTVWWDGRIVGGWVQHRASGEIRMQLDDLGAEARVAIDEAAQRTAAFLGDVLVKPRFPAPLDKALSLG